MSRFLDARLKRLEQHRKRPNRVRSHVVSVDMNGRIIGNLTKHRPVMIVTNFGTDETWETALMAQQVKLMSELNAAEDATQTKDETHVSG